jgi:molybdopterin/thiamine biosynthesis adenylyltransferase
VDNEILTAGNIGRHWLGPEHLERNKAEACQDELSGMYHNYDIRAESWGIMERIGLLSNADLVIDATGEEAVSFAVNEILMRARPQAPDAVYVWLAGNGAAAQAFLVSGKSNLGACRKCLHPVLGAAAHYDPVLSGVRVREQPAACGEAAFLPYGVAAPAIAAGLGARICLDWAKGNLQPMLRTLRIDSAVTIMVPDCDPTPSAECPCCGARKE